MRKAIVIALAVVLVAVAGALPAMAGPVNGAALPRADVQTDRDPGDPQVSNVPGPRSVRVLADYDIDNDGLIDVDSLAKLNAIRWDLDGDGSVSSSDKSKYDAAFPDAVAGMGCKLVDHDDNAATAKTPVCTGYELTANLDFDKNSDGNIDADDYYYNGGKGWALIGNATKPFTATFNGDNKTISNLYINIPSTDSTADIGLLVLLASATPQGTIARIEVSSRIWG